MASARLGWLRGLVNLGLALGQDTRFRDLIRDETLTYGAGLELVVPEWPLAAFAELTGSTRLEAPFAARVDQTLESLAGLRVTGLNRLDILLVAGFGLLGPSAPGARIGTILQLRLGPEKRGLASE
jgi:hypothetical protein